MIYLSENEYREMKSYVSETHLAADLISQLYEEVVRNESVTAHYRRELEKAQKKIVQLEKKLKVINILKGKA